MRLAQLRALPDTTLADLHHRAGDATIVASRPDGVDVTYRFVGDGWLLMWRGEDGTQRTELVRSERVLWRCLHRLSRYGYLPRMGNGKTLRGLAAVGG